MMSLFTSHNMEDEPLGGSFHASPPRSTQAPPAGHTLGGAEDLITLTAVSSVVSSLVHKVNSLETELKDTKKLFKDVVGKLVKKVKAMEFHIPTDVPTGVAPAGVSNKGKTPTVEEDITVKERTLKQLNDRLGEDGLQRGYHDEDQAQVGQTKLEANASLSKTLLGDDVTEDNFPEVISTPLGEINALYRSDQSTKHFTTLREILHMVDRQDLLKLYGMLMDSQEGGKGSFVWNNQSLWQIRSWRLYTLSNVHVLETVSGEVLYMFVDVSYPLSVKLMQRMLKHKLEIDKDVVGIGDMNLLADN
ncbi:hypothetical protein Tco_0003952 [Tanacetum coccineum]